jgi:hypothetical protein
MGGKNMLEHFEQIVDMLHDANFGKAFVALYDREKYVTIKHGLAISLPIKEGDAIVSGSAAYQTIHTRKKVKEIIGAEVIGIEYYAVSFPIIINGEVIGGIVTAVPTESLSLSDNYKIHKIY